MFWEAYYSLCLKIKKAPMSFRFFRKIFCRGEICPFCPFLSDTIISWISPEISFFYVPHTMGGGWDGGLFEFLPEGG